MSNYTREQLEEMGLFELRQYARAIKVKSPTSHKKPDLINLIMERQSNPVAPDSGDTRQRGRPPYRSFVGGNSGNNYNNNNSNNNRDGNNYNNSGNNNSNNRDGNNNYNNSGNNNRDGNYNNSNSNNNYNNNNNNAGNRDGGSNYGVYTQPRSNLSVAESEPDDQSVNIEEREGIIEIHADGFGFVRVRNYEASEKDAYLSNQFIRRLGIRRGDKIKGQVRRLREDKYIAMFNVLEINGVPVEQVKRRPQFDDLTPIYPDKRFNLELPSNRHDIAIRSIDLIAPIGKGQRGMIVSPPKAGKTTILKKVANSICRNHPEAHLIVLLVDERPEEVTDMQRSIPSGEVVYSTFDEMPDHHTRVAELVLHRAKRLVEMGKDVVILLDSLTRLARAYNSTVPPTGRTLSGGLDPGALHPPKRFFGSARNIENGGSLTIIATALVDTGSRMDEVIYEEFKGTGNMEIHLDRRLSEKRIFPAIDLNKSSTRREDLLLSQRELEGIWSIRKILSVGDTQEATEQLITMMLKSSNNLEFIDNLQMWLKSLK